MAYGVKGLEEEMRFFVSYARADLHKVDPLAQRLRQAGNDVWLDIGLVGGQPWWDNILQQIREADAFIAIVSGSSLKSEACRIERQYAARLGKPILPLAIEELSAGRLPSDISRLQIVDCSRLDENTAYALMAAIMQLPAFTPLPDPLPEPPDAPSSYWGNIGDQINAQTLTLDQQYAIVGHLEDALAPTADPAEKPVALDLLSQMEKRVDLYAKVDRRIALLKQKTSNGPGAASSTKPSGPDPTADLLAIVYEDETTAESAANRARRLAADLVIQAYAIAAISRDKEGTYRYKQVSSGPGARLDTFWWQLFGVLFGVSALPGMPISARRGTRSWGKIVKSVIDEQFQEQVRDLVKPGTSALFMILGTVVAPDQAVEALSPYGGTVLKNSLSKEARRELRASLQKGD
jgi:uncharacterized membrane protein